MQFVGKPSWGFSAHLANTLHVPLYVRDALRLPADTALDVPPRLAGMVPDRSELLSDQESAEAGEQWLSWWRALLAIEARARAQALSVATGRVTLEQLSQSLAHRYFHELSAAGAQRDAYAGLADRQALQRAAVLLSDDATEWFREQERAYRDRRPRSSFDRHVIATVAEQVAHDRNVTIDQIHGAGIVVLVQGSWWLHAVTGVALYSPDAAHDQDQASALLREVFEGGLRR